MCHEVGARVARNVRLADMNIDVLVSDDHHVEVVADWLSLWHGVQQVVDAFIALAEQTLGDCMCKSKGHLLSAP